MKKNYETPSIEKVSFEYREQVVASPATCESVWVNVGGTSCTSGNSHLEYLK